MDGIERMVTALKGISDRPLVCTEWLSRSQGDAFGRVLPAFSRHQIHWYNWTFLRCIMCVGTQHLNILSSMGQGYKPGACSTRMSSMNIQSWKISFGNLNMIVL